MTLCRKLNQNSLHSRENFWKTLLTTNGFNGQIDLPEWCQDHFGTGFKQFRQIKKICFPHEIAVLKAKYYSVGEGVKKHEKHANVICESPPGVKALRPTPQQKKTAEGWDKVQ